MKIGDRVRVKSEYLMVYGEPDLGTIVDINYSEKIIGIEFDDILPHGHSCQGKGKNGYCWNLDVANIIIEGDIESFKEELNKITL